MAEPSVPVVRGLVEGGAAVKDELTKRGAIREALQDGADALALELKAGHVVADRFQRVVRREMGRAGEPPNGIKERIMSRLRGGPATLFDGPGARRWGRRVEALGRDVFDAARHGTDVEVRSWLEQVDLTREDFGRRYREAVEDNVRRGYANDVSSPKVAILREQAVVDAEQRLARSWSLTKLRVTKVVMAAAVGGTLGHVADLQEPWTVPDWLETTVAAAVLGGGAAGRNKRTFSDDALAARQVAEVLGAHIRRLRAQHRRVVNELVSIVDPSLRAPPLTIGQPLSGPLVTALQLLDKRSQESAEAILTMSSKDRGTLAAATERLALEAQDLDLIDEDSPCAESIAWLGECIDRLTAAPTDDYEDELKRGQEFVQILCVSLFVASRLEAYSLARKEKPPPPPALRVA